MHSSVQLTVMNRSISSIILQKVIFSSMGAVSNAPESQYLRLNMFNYAHYFKNIVNYQNFENYKSSNLTTHKIVLSYLI